MLTQFFTCRPWTTKPEVALIPGKWHRWPWSRWLLAWNSQLTGEGERICIHIARQYTSWNQTKTLWNHMISWYLIWWWPPGGLMDFHWGLVKGWTYYACPKEDADGATLETLELYLDAAEQYPAVFSRTNDGKWRRPTHPVNPIWFGIFVGKQWMLEHHVPRSTEGPRLRGKLVIDKSSSLCPWQISQSWHSQLPLRSWIVSLILTLAIMAAGVWQLGESLNNL